MATVRVRRATILC